MNKQLALFCLVTTSVIFCGFKLGDINIITDVSVLNCINPCKGMHLYCANPATSHAITTTTARCICDETNPEKSYCIKEEQIIELPKEILDKSKTTKTIKLINYKGEELTK
jgi:hypothetical protein